MLKNPSIKFLHPYPNADEFQNLIISCVSTDTCQAKCSRGTDR